jgi:hypothetical protein
MSLALLACSEPHASGQSGTTGSLGYESPAPVARAPLAPLQGYAGPPSSRAGEPAGGTTAAPGWQASPRWAAIKGNGCIEVEPDPQAKSAGGNGMKVEACGGEKVKAPQQGQAGIAPQSETVEMAPQDADPNMPAPE